MPKDGIDISIEGNVEVGWDIGVTVTKGIIKGLGGSDGEVIFYQQQHVSDDHFTDGLALIETMALQACKDNGVLLGRRMS